MSKRPAKSLSPDRRPAKGMLRALNEPKLAVKKGAPGKFRAEDIERLIHELEIHQVELEMQNAELRFSHAELEESRRRYSDLYDFAPVGYFTFDENGLILEINLTGADQLGVERGRLIKKPFRLYVASEDQDKFRGHRNQVYESQTHQACEIKLKKKNGTIFYAQLESILVESLGGQKRLRTAVSDITARKEAEEKLRETLETLQAVFQAAPLAIYTLDVHGKVKSWNRTAERIFGWSEKEVIGRVLPTAPAEKKEEFFSLRDRVLEGESFTGFETRRRRKDGSVIDVAISTALLYDAKGRANGIMAVLEDITERKRAEQAIQDMNDSLRRKNVQIQEATQARNRFFSYVSHELKTPLNSVIGFIQLLRNGAYGPLTREQSRALTRAHGNAEDLVHLINNILDMARIESGKNAPKVLEINMIELIEKICMAFEPFLQEKGLYLERKVDPAFPKVCLTDPAKIRSILLNLLSNAVKFTEHGRIRVELTPLSGRPGARLTVSDTGIGIRPSELEKIFEEYERSGVPQEAPAQYTGGTGLGLAIVKKMVSSLGGTIDVESRIGEGSTFNVELPAPP